MTALAIDASRWCRGAAARGVTPRIGGGAAARVRAPVCSPLCHTSVALWPFLPTQLCGQCLCATTTLFSTDADEPAASAGCGRRRLQEPEARRLAPKRSAASMVGARTAANHHGNQPTPRGPTRAAADHKRRKRPARTTQSRDEHLEVELVLRHGGLEQGRRR